MQRMKDALTPSILAKESLNLELRLQRYGEKKFRDLFVISGKWPGVFLEIFLKIRGASCKYVVWGLILEKMRGLSAKCREMVFSRNYFVEEKTHGPSSWISELRRPGPLWTSGYCRTRELTEARPSAAPVPESSDQGVGEGKDGQASSTTGSPRVGRQWRGVSPVAEPQLERVAARAR
jgi:hypothetical protein